MRKLSLDEKWVEFTVQRNVTGFVQFRNYCAGVLSVRCGNIFYPKGTKGIVINRVFTKRGEKGGFCPRDAEQTSSSEFAHGESLSVFKRGLLQQPCGPAVYEPAAKAYYHADKIYIYYRRVRGISQFEIIKGGSKSNRILAPSHGLERPYVLSPRANGRISQQKFTR